MRTSHPPLALMALIAGVMAGVFVPDLAFAQTQARTLGDMTNNIFESLLTLQNFLSVLSYTLGVYFSITGLYALRAHVDDPGRNELKTGLFRMGAAALFIFVPTAARLLIESISGDSFGTTDLLTASNPAVNPDSGTFDGQGLDQSLGRFVIDFAGPFLENLLPFFSYAAGLILLLVGLKRLALANGDGPQAPGGMGTIGTFLVAAMLMAFGWIMYTLQGSLFGQTQIFTNTAFNTSSGSATLDTRATNAMWGVFVFLRIVGYISVLRGIFMLRGVAEGGNVSMMAVGTHMIAGAMLANMGAFVNSIQCTFIGDPANFVFAPLNGGTCS